MGARRPSAILSLRRQIRWPFFSRELCRETHIVSANLKGGNEDFHGKGGKITENRALTDVNRRYFGIYDRFLRLIDVNAGGFRLKKGQAILHPISPKRYCATL